jgi:allophanate hydrolase subunit 1
VSRRLLPSGDAALLVECDSLEEVLALHDALAAESKPGIVELVPAARTILVAIDPARIALESAATWVRRIPAEAGSRATGAAEATATIPVVYDGDDLARTAALLAVSPEALVTRHTRAEWRVAFIGFAPGFGYLVSDDWPFEVPRLDAPRRLIGRTAAPLWDPAAEQPALLAPGRRVRFESVRAEVRPSGVGPG